MYFALTTLSTVGYGDMYPISNIDKILIALLQLIGIIFFSYVLGMFVSILESGSESILDSKLGGSQEIICLQSWLNLLSRFRNDIPVPDKLEERLIDHFNDNWKRDRRPFVMEHGFIHALPRSLKTALIVNYTFDDIFGAFSGFFSTKGQDNDSQDNDKQLLYRMAFGLMPRIFTDCPSSNIIHDEGSNVSEVVFIMEGRVSVGFTKYSETM